MKFIEIGIGNTWLIRTEIEQDDGTEFEQKGIIGPVHVESLYLRLWLRKRVVIIDSREGFKTSVKNRNHFKIIIGVKSK